MERADILKKYNDIFDEEWQIASMLVLYHMKRLEELGLISGGGMKFTPDGFDLVNDILDDGWKLYPEDIILTLHSLNLVEKEDVEAMVGAVLYLQDEGYDKIKSDLEELKLDPEDIN